MIDARELVSALNRNGCEMFFGVPDSLMFSLSAVIEKHVRKEQHVIAVNEGSAVALAIGSYLATGSPAAVYMQNSGLGNALNPLVSLVDPQVYGIPMVLIIGWRAEIDDYSTQIADEPQHRKQGEITLPLLDTLDIPFVILQHDSNTNEIVTHCIRVSKDRGGPIALIVRKGSFEPILRVGSEILDELPSRESAIQTIAETLDPSIPIFATTGMTSRELFESRSHLGEHYVDFLTVGGMGHAISIACGFALSNPRIHTVCLDGDGALLMHMGSMLLGARLPNLIHIVLNNGVHDSVGGQPTLVSGVDLTNIARSCGYVNVETANGLDSIAPKLRDLIEKPGSSFLEIKCTPGSRPELGRPTDSPQSNRDAFLNKHCQPEQRIGK